MFTKKHFINIFSAAFLLFIGALFVFKYGLRFGNLFAFSPVLFIALGVLILWIFDKKSRSVNYNFTGWEIAVVVGVVVFATALLPLIPQASRNGRFPAIMEWLTNFQQGNFPYATQTNPSGFPFLFFLASPFYLIGDAGYLEVFGLFLTLILILKSSHTKKEFQLKFFLLFFIPTTFYEISVRSELLTNTSIVIGLFYLAKEGLSEQKRNIYFFALALLFGVFLSTRLIVFVWLAMFLLSFFRNNLKNGIIFLTISLSVFLLSLLPFYLWDAETFINQGPFAIQTIYLPKWIFFVFPIFLLYTGWMIADFQELLFASGVLTFLLVSLSMIITIGDVGISEAIFNSRFDISYYILSVPFFILALKEYKVDRFLGKVMLP